MEAQACTSALMFYKAFKKLREQFKPAFADASHKRIPSEGGVSGTPGSEYGGCGLTGCIDFWNVEGILFTV